VSRSIAVAAAFVVARYMGGDWGRALQIELLFAVRRAVRCSFIRPFPSKL
jgi:hypothetical protein